MLSASARFRDSWAVMRCVLYSYRKLHVQLYCQPISVRRSSPPQQPINGCMWLFCVDTQQQSVAKHSIRGFCSILDIPILVCSAPSFFPAVHRRSTDTLCMPIACLFILFALPLAFTQ